MICKGSFDETWNSVLNYLGAKSYKTIKLDKKNGIIETKEISFIRNFTFEDDRGIPKDSTAYMVVALAYYGPSYYYAENPMYLKIRIQVLLEKLGEGTKISVKLLPFAVRVAGLRENEKNKYYKDWDKVVRSSGVLENELFSQLR